MAFLEKSDTFTDWMEKINQFHTDIETGFGIPSQEDFYDLTDGKYLQTGAFGVGKIEKTSTDTLDVTGTRFDFVGADATSNFSMPKNFLGGSLVTIVNNGQGFQIIQNDTDLNFRTVYNDVYEEWVSFKKILDNVSFGITKESIELDGYLDPQQVDDLLPMVTGGGTLTDAMNAQAQVLLNKIEMLKITNAPVTKETLTQNGVINAVEDGVIDVPKADKCGSISDTMNAQAQALLNKIETNKNLVTKIFKSVAEMKEYDKPKNNEIFLVTSYKEGYSFGGGTFVFSSAVVSENLATTFSSNHKTGHYKRLMPNNREYEASWGGAIPDGIMDCTVELQRVLDSMDTWSNMNFDNGNYIISAPIKMKKIGTSIIGKDIYNCKITMKNPNTCIKIMEACRFKDIRIIGSGVFTHDVLILDEKGHNRADVDVDIVGCYLAESLNILRIYGRGVKFEDCNVFNIKNAWLDLQFPPQDVFEPGTIDNNNVRQGMRGYIFKNNRNHYSPSAFVYNTGWNSRNARGFMFTDNQIEGSGRFISGAAIDVLASGNIAYHSTRDWKYFEFNYAKNVTIVGNSFSQYNDEDFPKPLSGEFLTAANNIENLVIEGNTFDGFGKDIVRLYAQSSINKNIKIANNIYTNCFSGGCILNLQTGTYDNIVVQEYNITAPNSSFIAVKRTTQSIAANNHSIDVRGNNQFIIHNLTRATSNGSTRKSGVYVGTGTGLVLNIQIGYEPKWCNVRSTTNDVGILQHGTSQFQNGLGIGTDGNITATGNMNKVGVAYVWEAF